MDTTEQLGHKAEAEWPWPTHTVARVLVKAAPVVPGNYFYAIRFGNKPADDEETYIPVSALFSDEAQEAACKAAFVETTDDWRASMRAAFEAVIEQVGGGQGAR